MSIRSKLLLAFLVFSGFTSAVAVYAIRELESTSRMVSETYNKPLMAINFARSALFAFSSMDRALARAQLAADPESRRRHLAAFGKYKTLFHEDLSVAERRSLSPKARTEIKKVRSLVENWSERGKLALAGGIDRREWLALDRLASEIAERFDLLIDHTAGDGFLIRQGARKAIDSSRLTYSIVVLAAVAMSLIITLLLGRSILGPLTSAVKVAERIAGGELKTEIARPRGGETGALLRSMSVMQNALRGMMEREETLRKSAQARLVDAIESSPEAVIVVDRDDRIVIANSQVANFLPGIADLVVPGNSFQEIIRRANRMGLYDASMGGEEIQAARYVEARKHARSADEVKLADGRWLRVSRSRTRDGGTVVMWSDITEIMEREKQLERAKEQAESANLAKNRFLANMSHELRTPLNAVIGFSEIMANECMGPIGNPQYRQYAADIRDSGSHLLEIINDILDLSKSEAGALQIYPRRIEIGEIIEPCNRMIRQQCEQAGIEFVVEQAPDLPAVRADPGRMKQILLNLLSNSVKFTPNGGRIELAASPAAGGGVDFSVTDTGIGMDPEGMRMAMEPFGQADSTLARKFEGTGLGLPLAKQLVELHGGDLWISSAPGQGTVVKVHIPNYCDEVLTI